MSKTKGPRPIALTHVLQHNRKVGWQLTLGGSALMLALSFFVTGSPTGGTLLILAAIALLAVGGRGLATLLRHDLPLLREGEAVLAKVVAPVSKDEKQALYQISYRLPAEQADRNGVFVAERNTSFQPGEPLLVMVSREDPGNLLEVTGHYEELMHPVLEKEYA